MAFSSVERWEVAAVPRIDHQRIRLMPARFQNGRADRTDSARQALAFSLVLVLHASMLFMLFNRSAAFGNGKHSGAPAQSMSLFTMINVPAADPADALVVNPTADSHKKVVPANANAGAVPAPEWRRATVVVAAVTGSGSSAGNAQSPGQQSAANATGGDGDFDPYAGAAPKKGASSSANMAQSLSLLACLEKAKIEDVIAIMSPGTNHDAGKGPCVQ